MFLNTSFEYHQQFCITIKYMLEHQSSPAKTRKNFERNPTHTVYLKRILKLHLPLSSLLSLQLTTFCYDKTTQDIAATTSTCSEP